MGIRRPPTTASFSPRTPPADLIVGYFRFCVNYSIGILSHAAFECCAHLPTSPFIHTFLLQLLFLDQRDSVSALLKRPQFTCTRLTISNLQNDAYHPRKATTVDLTHQTYTHLLCFTIPSRWTSSTFVIGRTSSIDREDPLYCAHPVSGISEVVRTSQFVSP